MPVRFSCIRCVITDIRSMLRRDHFRTRWPSFNSGTRHSGSTTMAISSTLTIFCSMAKKTMKAAAPRISNGARRASATVDDMSSSIVSVSVVQRLINCPTSIWLKNLSDCRWR